MSNVYEAILKFQAENKTIPKNSQGYGYKYTNLQDIYEIIQEDLTKLGLAIFTQINDSTITTTVYHAESETSISSSMKLPEINDPQKIGAAITYYRRYTISGLLNIITDEDTDGVVEHKTGVKTPAKSSYGVEFASKEQKTELFALAKKAGVFLGEWKEWDAKRMQQEIDKLKNAIGEGDQIPF